MKTVEHTVPRTTTARVKAATTVRVVDRSLPSEAYEEDELRCVTVQ